ncbi:hypothetical protein Psi02_15440 [Planotetraspora silvatica]|uniref:Uncharacterized protein n=1 Tax=Planotetraspora silvatica TaxID=234614 RepID=A0A8J3UV67_9ACTN|nr:hypothetical protein Psi02_15440 [Planotetraspora silvatica]
MEHAKDGSTPGTRPGMDRPADEEMNRPWRCPIKRHSAWKPSPTWPAFFNWSSGLHDAAKYIDSSTPGTLLVIHFSEQPQKLPARCVWLLEALWILTV